jgi:outer membrane protein
MAFRSFAAVSLCVFLALPRAAAVAQQPSGTLAPVPTAVPSAVPAPNQKVTLSLAEALDEARQNSPVYRQALNGEAPANWAVRNAYAALLPGFSVGGGLGYTGAGSSTFGGTTFSQTSPALSSDYNFGFNWQLSGATISAPGQQKANRRATESDIDNAAITLKTSVTTQYLTTLQAVAQVGVAERQVQRNADFLQLAQARFTAGQATLIDVRQAQVTKSQSDLALLQARQTANEAKLELFRQMGIPLPGMPDQVVLTDSFPVDSPTVALPDLLSLADEQNPTIKSAEARENAAKWSVRSAMSSFLPRLTAQAGWSGFTQQFTDKGLLINQAYNGALGSAANCTFQNKIIQGLTYGSGGIPGEPNGGLVADCNAYAGLNGAGTALDPVVEQQILSGNDHWPFNFSNQPFQASLSISLPIFTGFSRHLQKAQAEMQRDNATEQARAALLQVHADVQSRYLALQTAWQAIGVQRSAADAAQDQVKLASDRFKIGSGTSLELADAENALTLNEGNYINAVYAYHKALAALEAAVGHSLR